MPKKKQKKTYIDKNMYSEAHIKNNVRQPMPSYSILPKSANFYVIMMQKYSFKPLYTVIWTIAMVS